MLTTREAARASGIAFSTLQAHVTHGVITPAVAGRPGKGGQGHRWSVTQVVGLCVVTQLRKREGLTTAGVGLVIEAFGRLTEADLLARFEAGQTFYLTAFRQGEVPVVLLTDPQLVGQLAALKVNDVAGVLVDVRAAYRAVKAGSARRAGAVAVR